MNPNLDPANRYPEEMLEHPALKFELVKPFEKAAAMEGGGSDAPRGRILEYLAADFKRRYDWAGTHRSTFEGDWRYCEQEYSLANERRLDNERIASIYERDPDDSGDEKDEERASISLPVGLEVVEQQVPRYYDALFGADLDKYVDLVGRDSVDQDQSDSVEAFMNYQQGHEINTPMIGYRWLRDGCIYGTGIMGQGWDFASNRRTAMHIPLWDMWFDPAGLDVDSCRFIIHRRRMTVAELMEMREAGKCFFTDKALEGSLDEDGMIVEHDTLGDVASIATPGGAVHINPDKQVSLYIYMQKDRWIYVVNQTLVVAVADNLVPPENTSPGAAATRLYPVFLFTPNPALSTEDTQPGVYGLGLLSMARVMIDMQNSLAALMHGGVARSALGITFVDPDECEALGTQRQTKAGDMIPCRNPEKAVNQLNFPDVSGPCLNGLSHLDMRLERLHGVNNAMRGMATYATETATAKAQDLNQSNHRMAQGIKLGYYTMRKFWTVALHLNKGYLEESEYIRVIGEEATWHKFSRADMEGVAGKDLVPTGMPLAASQAFLAQQGLNLVALMQQLKAGGMVDLDDRKVLRDTLIAMGYRNIDQVCRREMQVGQDPTQENAILLQGGRIMVGPHDDHDSHYQNHMSLYYVPQARDAFKMDPNLQSQFDAHIATHAQALEGAGQGMPAGKPSEGLGSGTGLPGMNTSVPTARPKPAGELQAQMGAQQ